MALSQSGRDHVRSRRPRRIPEADRAAADTRSSPIRTRRSRVLAARLRDLCGDPLLTISDVAPNPDMRLLSAQSSRFGDAADRPGVIVALGGGSVIDSAKVFAAAPGCFTAVRAVSNDGRRRGRADRHAHHRGPDHRGHRQRGDLLGDGLGHSVREEVLAGAPGPLPGACGGRSAAHAGQAATAHDQHRARRAFSCARKPVERERQSALGASCGGRGARDPRRPASACERSAESRAANAAWRRRRFRPASLSRTRAPPSRIRSPIRSRFTMALRTASHAPSPCPWSCGACRTWKASRAKGWSQIFGSDLAASRRPARRLPAGSRGLHGLQELRRTAGRLVAADPRRLRRRARAEFRRHEASAYAGRGTVRATAAE